MAIKMNLMFNLVLTNPIMMSFTFNDFEFMYPGDSHLAKETVVKYLTVMYILWYFTIMPTLLYTVHPNSMVIWCAL